ncbi:hypothetical protein OAB20_06345 [Winogradskyella sp.]|nr:hypothetical protein [Winogradskyella sp.]
MKKGILLIGIVTLLISCSSPMDKNFNEKTAKEDIEAIRSKIDTTEFQLLAGSMMRLKFKGEKIEEMTYSEILEDGKKWKIEQEKIEAEQKALAEKAAREEAEKFKRLNEAVVVSCFEKGYAKYDYEDYITYKFVIKNKSDKKVRAVKGEISFTNLFDDKISSLSFVYDKPIEAGKEVTWNATTDYNQFKDEDKTLKNKDLKDLKVVWKPEKIIFEDGTSLE